jgi:hypothetical protein
MRDLKKEINLPDDFTSFSFDVHTSYNFTESGCCLFQVFCQKGVYWFSILIRDPKNTNASPGMKFKVTNVRDVASKVTKHFSFRVVEIAQDI